VAQHALLGLQPRRTAVVLDRFAPDLLAEIGRPVRNVIQDPLRDGPVIHSRFHAAEHTPAGPARHTGRLQGVWLLRITALKSPLRRTMGGASRRN
jgi:hypothetical protein